ncbi:alpha/beta hydrolase family protein [Ohtaekwangia koreensis]|uniref:Secretory lipase n=1 Tax=Ohtaekwangia koreensis TaxID=688867 RepID=A0A1T5MH26_9BACT|nr:alpha/beta fold hydrolase [Ohtaekwangia koreensis]SKC87179.1 Secretory lipase [Ohtaekwangia koreensis]
MLRSNYLALMTAGFMLGCGDESVSNHTPAVAETHLVSVKQVSDIPLEMLKTFAQLAGQEQFTPLVKYSVKTYTLVYETEYNGKSIKASGSIYVPQGLTQKAPLISLQHGTTFLKSEAPSVSSSPTGMEYFASAGYIAIMPDFIGYGESAAIFHPYYDQALAAGTVIDMIKSSREFLEKENIAFNDQLFLAGYSEGGFVTLAAAKEIENNAAHNMKVTAVAAGAGGYDLTHMLNSITTSTSYTYPGYLAFVLMAYNNTYQWNKPLEYFFQDKYARALATYMNGNYGGSFINSKLTTHVPSLLNAEFYTRLKSPSGELDLKRALTENSIRGWNTKIPTRLYHGTKDEIIPYQNSEATLESFRAAGSTSVSLTAIPSGTHGSSFFPMLKEFVPWFETMRK